MAIISGSPLMCPQCQAKMQAITSSFNGVTFHTWACIPCGRFYDRPDLIQRGVLDETDDWENMVYEEWENGVDDMKDFCQNCQHKAPNCRSVCELFDDANGNNITY